MISSTLEYLKSKFGILKISGSIFGILSVILLICGLAKGAYYRKYNCPKKLDQFYPSDYLKLLKHDKLCSRRFFPTMEYCEEWEENQLFLLERYGIWIAELNPDLWCPNKYMLIVVVIISGLLALYCVALLIAVFVMGGHRHQLVIIIDFFSSLIAGGGFVLMFVLVFAFFVNIFIKKFPCSWSNFQNISDSTALWLTKLTGNGNAVVKQKSDFYDLVVYPLNKEGFHFPPKKYSQNCWAMLDWYYQMYFLMFGMVFVLAAGATNIAAGVVMMKQGVRVKQKNKTKGPSEDKSDHDHHGRDGGESSRSELQTSSDISDTASERTRFKEDVESISEHHHHHHHHREISESSRAKKATKGSHSDYLHAGQSEESEVHHHHREISESSRSKRATKGSHSVYSLAGPSEDSDVHHLHPTKSEHSRQHRKKHHDSAKGKSENKPHS